LRTDAGFKRKERQAWAVLVAALVVFLLLAIFVPYGLRIYYLRSTVAKDATLEIMTGTVRVSRQSGAADVAAINGDTILEGNVVKTDNTSRALLTLFDGSTIFVYENSEVLLKRVRTTRFTRNMTEIVVDEKQGRLRIGVAPTTARAASFSVQTPQTVLDLEDGSYAVEVTPQGSSLSVRAGIAEATAQKTTVSVKRGQRSTVAPGQPPSVPASAALDLVLNGDFSQLDVGWLKRTDVEAGRRDDITGQTQFLSPPDMPGVHFIRLGSKNSHGENGIYQDINRDVSDFVSLKLSVDLRLMHQSLSGGGYLGSEYPLLVAITYRDYDGKQVRWAHGFYYQNDAAYPTNVGEQVPADVWIPYEKDLLSLDGYPKPARILSVEVVASGWDYESMVKSVSVLAE
jgi:hypothetical protein